MHVILDKAGQKVLRVLMEMPEGIPMDQLVPEFNPKTMQSVRCDLDYLPARFAVDKGVLRDLDAPVTVSLDALKASKLAEVEAAFQQALGQSPAAAAVAKLKAKPGDLANVVNQVTAQALGLAAQQQHVVRLADLRQRIAQAEAVPVLEQLRIDFGTTG